MLDHSYSHRSKSMLIYVQGQKVTEEKPSIKQKKATPPAIAEGSEKEDLEKPNKPVSKLAKTESTDVDVKISEPEGDSTLPEQKKVQEDGKVGTPRYFSGPDSEPLQDGYKSESELSVLLDEPPKPKRKRKDSKVWRYLSELHSINKFTYRRALQMRPSQAQRRVVRDPRSWKASARMKRRSRSSKYVVR